jgi:hypothetical protein
MNDSANSKQSEDYQEARQKVGFYKRAAFDFISPYEQHSNWWISHLAKEVLVKILLSSAHIDRVLIHGNEDLKKIDPRKLFEQDVENMKNCIPEKWEFSDFQSKTNEIMDLIWKYPVENVASKTALYESQIHLTEASWLVDTLYRNIEADEK